MVRTDCIVRIESRDKRKAVIMLKLFSKKNEEATEETEAKKVNTQKVAIICGSVAGALLVVFVGFGIFFQSHFFFRSTVNGVISSA